MQLYNIIIIYLLIGVIINYIFKTNFSILSCGIFAWVGKDIKFFRKDLFNILGMYNDSRGGDACGIYYDDNWYKGVGNDAKYEKLVVKHNLHNTLKLKKYPIIIGHDRKMSVGHTGIDNAQPVVLVPYDSDDILYVHAHNGTITNFRALAKKYNVEVLVGESDSIVMAKLIDTAGWDVLSEYEGSAALVMYKKSEPNVIYAFHGRSKSTEYAVVADERPLAFLTFPGKGTYISSDIDHLRNLSIPDKNILPFEFKYNIVYKLEGDLVTEFHSVDRSAINAKFPVVVVNNRSSITPKSPLSYGDGLPKNAIRYHEGLYRIYDIPAHGTYIVDDWGYPIKNTKFNALRHYEVSFIHGILMKSRESFERMIQVLDGERIFDAAEFYETTNWSKIDAVMKLKMYSLYPFWRFNEDLKFSGYIKSACWINEYKGAGYYYADGIFQPLFSKEQYRLYIGEINSVTTFSYLYTVTDFTKKREFSPDIYDFSETTDEDLKDIKERIYGKDKKIITLPINKKSDTDGNTCAKCDLWRTDPTFCQNCSWEVNDDDIKNAYKEHEDAKLGCQVIYSTFKPVLSAIDESVDTYDSIAIDLKDDEIEDLIDDFRKIQTKLTKY